MNSHLNCLQHPDLEIRNDTISLACLSSVQFAERRYVHKHTVNMETKFSVRLVLAMLLMLLTLSLLQHWMGADSLKDGIMVITIVSIWPTYYYIRWMSIRESAVRQFRNCHPNYEAVVP